ncbi:rod shape-determining protein [Clostridium botulinum]|uniref:Cell division protein FtsA n=1 Tax=Clostridium botulinum C/D str. DC5 TaxID=1443128 RepID=A0A0A0IPR1_CLOBO|nr:cell division FtsA domain-containing protein [Clostridium botulinum]KEI04627.1 cell division protein FtsA [Clostridium botulinum C/D str. BKT75002]KEI06080.1 cell division protein FtsA [Clostridium botulinum C/D str. BKT2873]KGM93714.1 cell division protein FtsA [Clostridium botulinum D str. CCUG 7971]KGN01481.1 cell division protein FtsA [Clostridium botulinum C/D str. DC5]KOC49800.1 cell division protein FtsA [Clostridium botulinum]
MKILDINPKDIIFALDIGTRSIIGNVGIVKDRKFHTLCEKYMEHEERAMIDGQIHDINLVASTVNSVKKSIEEELGIEVKDVAIAAAGRFLRTTEVSVGIQLDANKEIDGEIIRSLELTAVKKAEEEINKQTQGKLYCVGYSVKNYYLNGYVISNLLSQRGENIAADVIATFLPRSVVDSLYSVMDKVGLNVTSLTLEPIAAMEAAVPKKLRLLNIALVDVGAGTSDIAISSNDSISAYGMVPMAGDEVTEAIVQNFLVDFNTAEKIKISSSRGEEIKFVDVLGIENNISAEEVNKIIKPVVDKIADEIGKKIIELNGGKSPNAVFLVGGGAHTYNFREALGESLNLSEKRIGIKGREAVINCINYNEELGSAGVTVLGIALVAIKKSGHDFIDVVLNNDVISLFNSHKHTVMDVMMQSGINHKTLIGKNGKNIRFVLNGITRVAFGTLGKGADIYVNDEKSTIDTEVSEGDKIKVDFAKDGKDASPKIIEYVRNINSISFYINDGIENIYPVAFINNERCDLEEIIKEGDEVKILFPSTLGEYIKYYEEDKHYLYFLRNEQIHSSYVIREGDRIYKKKNEELIEEQDNSMGEISKNNIEDEIIKKDINEKVKNETHIKESVDNLQESNEENILRESVDIENKAQIQETDKDKLDALEISNDGLHIVVNEKSITLRGKDKYVFVDIFDNIEFDLTISHGNLILLLNDKKAGYYDELKEGDIVKIFWDNI